MTSSLLLIHALGGLFSRCAASCAISVVPLGTNASITSAAAASFAAFGPNSPEISTSRVAEEHLHLHEQLQPVL